VMLFRFFATGRLLALLLMGLVLLGGFVPFARAASSPEVFSAEQIRADFTLLYQTLQAAHFDVYAHRSKKDYDELFQRMQAEFTQPMTRDAAEVAFQRFVAFGRVAHARIDGLQTRFAAYRQQGGRALPIQIRFQDGAIWIAENYSGLDSFQRGDRVLTINGMTVTTLLPRLAAHVSADNDYLLSTLIELGLPALLWQELGPLDQFTLQLQRAQQPAFTVIVPARTRAEAQAADAKQAPVLALDWDKREARVIAADAGGHNQAIGYLRPGPFYNNEADATDPWDNRAFIRFIDQAFTGFNNDKLSAVLIDLRDNPGGDNSFSDHMLSWFATKPYRFASDFRIRVSDATTASNAKRLQASTDLGNDTSQQFAARYAQHKPGDIFSYPFPMTAPRAAPRYQGTVYLLINRRSYSNTVMVAAIGQDYGFATVLGEETADLATTYGAMEQFTLTQTGLVVGYPKAHIIRPNGSLVSRGVQPDWPIRTPVVESADDPVLKQALQQIRQQLASSQQ
jgi:C-terminal processing protease CtpA/Prc